MKHLNRLKKLLLEFTAMSQRESVPNLEKAVYQELADFCISQEEYKLGLQVVDAAIQLFPFSPEFAVKKSELFLLLKMPKKALSVLEEIDHLASLSRKAQLLRAEALSATGNNKEALDLLGQLDKERKNDFSVYQLQASIFENMQQFESLYHVTKNQILNAPKEQIGSLLNRHLFFTEITSNHADAVSFLDKVIDLYPYSSTAWLNLGTAHKMMGEYFEATDAFEYSIAIDPTNKSAYFQTAECLESIDEYEKATKYYNEYLANINHRDSETLVKLGNCLLKTNQTKTAKSFLQEAIEQDPQIADAYYLLGKLHLTSKPKTAIAYLQEAFEFEPENEIYINELANAYFVIDNHDEAIHYYQEAIVVAPNLLDTWLPFMKFLIKTKRHELLENTLDELSAYFNQEQYIYLQVAILFETGKGKEGKYWLVEALNLNFDAHSLLFYYAPELEYNQEISVIIAQHKRK